MVTPPTNADWLALTVEDAIDPTCRFVTPTITCGTSDPHASPHAICLTRSWRMSGGHNVVSTVFIECALDVQSRRAGSLRPVGEIEFVNGIAAMSASGHYGRRESPPASLAPPICARGCCGRGARCHLVAGGGRFRGIRLGGTWDASDEVPNHRTNPPQGMFLRQDFRSGFAHLAPRQLTFEAWCYHHNPGGHRSCPRLSRHHDYPRPLWWADRHWALCRQSRRGVWQWRTHVRELATCPNVVAKVGGLQMEVNGALH